MLESLNRSQIIQNIKHCHKYANFFCTKNSNYSYSKSPFTVGAKVQLFKAKFTGAPFNDQEQLNNSAHSSKAEHQMFFLVQ